MSFASIPPILKSQEYFDNAVKQANRRVVSARGKFKRTMSSIDKSKNVELSRIELVNQHLQESLRRIIKTFPDIATLDPFYKELFRLNVEARQYRKSLAAVAWALERIHIIWSSTTRLIKHTDQIGSINAMRNAFYGRAVSVLEQIETDFVFLEKARKHFKKFPVVRTTMPTAVIAGFPNVGKTTLLSALTGSTPRIAPYPFTTQNIMIGYLDKKIQIIDTPGLLDRPLDERNTIEHHAILALRHLATIILYLIDPTETCGYSLEEQVSLYEQISKTFEVPVTVVINKADMTTGKKVPFKDYILVSAKEG